MLMVTSVLKLMENKNIPQEVKNSWQAQKIIQRSRFIMWIVATHPEFQETQLESQVAEGNMQAQNIIFHLYCTYYFTFIFAAGASWQKSSISKRSVKAHGAVHGAVLPLPAVTRDRVCPQQRYCNGEPACVGSEQMETLMDVQHFTSSLLVKKKKKKLVRSVTPTTLSWC